MQIMPETMTAKLSSKSQAVIPKPVRERLGVGPGDVVEFEIRDGEVLIRRAPSAERVDPFAVFQEWEGEADEKAFADL
jgi:antitoxin PrlF